MSDDMIPGTLYRLTVFEADGMVAEGYPKIYATISRFRAAVKAQERRDLPDRTWIKEGCARGPWLSLDGPVSEGPVNHWSIFPGPHPAGTCLPEVDEPKPPTFVEYNAA